MTDREIYDTIRLLNENINTDQDVENFMKYLRDNIHHVESDRLARSMLNTLYPDHIERFEPSALTDDLVILRDNAACDFDSLPDTYFV